MYVKTSLKAFTTSRPTYEYTTPPLYRDGPSDGDALAHTHKKEHARTHTLTHSRTHARSHARMHARMLCTCTQARIHGPTDHRMDGWKTDRWVQELILWFAGHIADGQAFNTRLHLSAARLDRAIAARPRCCHAMCRDLARQARTFLQICV